MGDGTEARAKRSADDTNGSMACKMARTDDAEKQRLQDEAQVKRVREAAEAGSQRAAVLLGCMYLAGAKGLTPNVDTAMRYYKQAADAFDTLGMAIYALALINRKKNQDKQTQTKALIPLSLAAAAGNEAACYTLGMLFKTGDRGLLSVDKGEAAKWLRKMLSCEDVYHCRNPKCTDEQRRSARAFLDTM